MKNKTYKTKKRKPLLAAEPQVPYGHSQGEGPLTFEKVWKTIQENDRMLTQKFQETDRKFQETDRMFRETDKKLNRLEELFVGQWGKLVESLVKGKLVELLNKRGIKVIGVQQRAERFSQGEPMEIDLMAVNSTETVAVEVKTTLRVKDIDKFTGKLKRFKKFFPEYQNYSLFGAVAYLQTGAEVEKYGQRQGLFTIRATGDSSSITNPADFKPVIF